MSSETPRTDAARGFFDIETAVDAEEMAKLERELAAANALAAGLREAAEKALAAAPTVACEHFHHARKDHHGWAEVCPCVKRWEQALAALDAALAKADAGSTAQPEGRG